MFEYLHDNLVLHTHVFYNLQRGKRQYTEELSSAMQDADTYFEFEAWLYPPLLLLPVTWARYGYNMEDVQTTYDKIDASYVWAIALLMLASTYEPESSTAGVRSTFQSVFTFLFISRKTVFDVFITAQQQHIAAGEGGILCHERDDHKPLLPKVSVTPELFEACRATVPPRAPSFCWAPIYSQVVPFKDIWLVPVEYDRIHQLVYMVRVIPKAKYDEIPVLPKPCVVTLPVIALVGETQQEYVLLEEACFFTTQLASSSDRKRNANMEITEPPKKRRKPKPDQT